MSRSPLLALACLSSLSLLACTDEPPPDHVALRPAACAHAGCGPEVPVVAGGTLAFHAEPAGLAVHARTSDSTIATVTDGALHDPDGFTLTALRPGTITLDLIDDDQRVLAIRYVHVEPADHLEARIDLIRGLERTTLDRISSDTPIELPADGHALLWIDAFAGDTRLLGALPYQLETRLAGGATLRHDLAGGDAARIDPNARAITFGAGDLRSGILVQAP